MAIKKTKRPTMVLSEEFVEKEKSEMNVSSKGIVFKRVDFKNIPEEGWYKATLIDVIKAGITETKLGKADMINCIFELELGYRVRQRMLLIPGNKSLVQKLVDSTVGNVKEVNLEKLIGKKVRVRICHYTNDKGTYLNINDIASSKLI